MEIRKVWCFYEQSGTFKNVFKKEFGVDAYDLDILNDYGETDYVIDLFNETEKAYNNEPSIFDEITEDDLIVAFFPCTHFSHQNELIYSRKGYNFRTWSKEQVDNYIAERERERTYFFSVLNKFVDVVEKRKIKMLFENPYGRGRNWLLQQKRFEEPSLIIHNRRDYCDYYIKPTMFYFYNFKPSIFPKKVMKYTYHELMIQSEQSTRERSLMSKEFAYNFINQYILGIR